MGITWWVFTFQLHHNLFMYTWMAMAPLQVVVQKLPSFHIVALWCLATGASTSRGRQGRRPTCFFTTLVQTAHLTSPHIVFVNGPTVLQDSWKTGSLARQPLPNHIPPLWNKDRGSWRRLAVSSTILKSSHPISPHLHSTPFLSPRETAQSSGSLGHEYFLHQV